jgi:hypothetical protein
MRALAPILVLVAGGCTWVTPADLESRKTEVDDDGDGFAKTEDCDDSAADVNPDADETWYDGIDQDCGGDDDYDADADGWVASEYVDEATAGVAGTGSLPGGDCDDSLADVNPAADDVWRDGADQDCSGNDDFDVDGDGYVRDDDVGQTTDYVEGSGNAPGGDCDDEEDTVNPGTTDTWRDGVDLDCSGNDDYDVDGDGYVRDDDVGLPTRYVEGSGTAPGGDCDDEVATINPATAEVWYDDIDNDCSELTDDDDADDDGYIALVSGGDDCDDLRSDVNPDAIESLSDAVDHDCDGDAVTFVMESLAANVDWLSSLAWSSPHDAVFSANNRSIYLSLASDRVDVTRPSTTGGSSTVVYYDSALAFGWDLTDMAAGPEELIDWQRNAGADPVFTLTDGHDFIATDDALFGATGLMLPTGRALRMGGYNLTTNARFGISYRLNPTTSSFSDFTDISMEMDSDGVLHAVGCESNSSWLQYMRAAPESLQSTDYDEAAAYEDMALQVCELDFYNTTTGTLTARTASGVQTWDFGPLEEPPVLVEDTLLSGYTALDIEVPRDGDDDWLIIADAANLGIAFIEPDGSDTLYSLGNAPRAVNAVFDPAHTGVGDPDMFVAVVDGSGDPYLLVGQPSTGFDSYAIPVSFSATNAVAWPDPTGTYVLVAVLGGNDVQYGIAER